MPGPIAVADASVLIALERLSLLQHLGLIFDRVLVPAAVRGEVLKKAGTSSSAVSVALTDLIAEPPFEPCDDFDSIDVKLLLETLGAGESEAISQTKQRVANRILIDDLRGRRTAELQGLRPEGTIKLLARLHRMGFLARPFSALERLRKEIRFRGGDALLERALRDLELAAES